MDIAELYKLVVENRTNDFVYKTGGDCDLNAKDTNGQSLLHYAVEANDLETTKFLLMKGVIYNNKNANGKTPAELTDIPEIKGLFQICAFFLEQVKMGNFQEVSKCVVKEKFLVNIREEGAFSPLHWAVDNCQEETVKLLLENGANMVQFTDKGKTPLHIAVYKKDQGITKLLLESTKRNKLLRFINAQTYEDKNTCLHIAAENGCFEIIKVLLKYGAVYDILNGSSYIPFDLCKTKKVKRFLKAIDKFFFYANHGDSVLVDELDKMEVSEFEAVTNAQNYVYHTLIQELIFFNHKNTAQKLLALLQKKNKKAGKRWNLEELKALQSVTDVHLRFSKIYIPKLQNISEQYVYLYDTQGGQWVTLKEGSYYLGNAYNLVAQYIARIRGPIEDENILIIDATLKKLQFDLDHISSSQGAFASEAEGYEYYYSLLYSELKTDIRHFIKIVEHYIDKPAQQFLAYIEQQEKLVISINQDLVEFIKQENYLAVCECIKKGADVNFLSDNGISPLQHAIQKRNAEIVKLLLETGANVNQNSQTLNGNTLLHIVATLDATCCKQNEALLIITKYLLQHGAIYNAINNDEKTAENVSKFQSITNLLQNIDMCFKYAEDDNEDIFLKLQNMEADDFKAATQSCSKKGYTLLQTAFSGKHKKIENKLLNILQG